MSEKLTRPLRPEEIESELLKIVPEELVKTFNLLIAIGHRSGIVTIHKSSVEAELHERGMDKSEIEAVDFRGIESLYDLAGWNVTTEPAGDSGQPAFELVYKFQRKSESV